MLVLSTRRSEKILLPDTQTTIEVVDIQSGSVRIGITAPDDVRVLRQGIPDRLAEWGSIDDAPVVEVPALPALKRLLDKRLDIAREGISEAQHLLRAGMEADARIILEKVDEDLHLLRRRIRREFEKAETLTCVP